MQLFFRIYVHQLTCCQVRRFFTFIHLRRLDILFHSNNGNTKNISLLQCNENYNELACIYLNNVKDICFSIQIDKHILKKYM